MKSSLFYFFIFSLLISCNLQTKSEEDFPGEAEKGLFVYEGKIPLTETTSLYQVISLKPGRDPGEGYYTLDEFVEEDGGQRQVGSFKGNYSTFYDDGNENDIEIHFHNSSQLTGVARIYPIANGTRIREEQFRKKDLILRRRSDDLLTVLDYDHQPVSSDLRHNLSRRASPVFTVEGKFAHVGDSAVFYEVNTERTWPVSKMGVYDQAIRQYHQLANEKNEGIYLKATGYSINWKNGKHRSEEALVLRKVISMSSSPVSE